MRRLVLCAVMALLARPSTAHANATPAMGSAASAKAGVPAAGASAPTPSKESGRQAAPVRRRKADPARGESQRAGQRNAETGRAPIGLCDGT